MKYTFILVMILAVALAGCGTDRDDADMPAGGDATESMTNATGTTEATAELTEEAAETMDEAEATDLSAGSGEMVSEDVDALPNGTPGVDTSNLSAAPEWKLYDLAGNAVSSDQFAGKVVLVDFWATWCGPCRKSIPDIIDLYEDYKDQGLTVVGVSLDQKGPSVVEPFVQKMNITYPIVMGNQQVVQDFGGIRGIPTAFVISQDGKIYQRYVGLRPRSVYEKDIKDLLGLTS